MCQYDTNYKTDNKIFQELFCLCFLAIHSAGSSRLAAASVLWRQHVRDRLGLGPLAQLPHQPAHAARRQDSWPRCMAIAHQLLEGRFGQGEERSR